MTISRSRMGKLYIKGMVARADDAYKQYPDNRRAMVYIKSSSDAYEEVAYFSGLGMAQKKFEGAKTPEDDIFQGPDKRWTHQAWGLMLRITREALDDDRKGLLKQAKDFGESIQQTKQAYNAQLFMNAANTTYHTTADGKAFCAVDHNLIGGGTFSNLAGAAALPSESALETAILAFEAIPNERGLPVMRQAKSVVCGKLLKYDFERLLESEGRPGTDYNDVNAIRRLHSLQLVVDPYITDKRWFISGEKDERQWPCWYDRIAPEIRSFGDFQTGDMLFKLYMRFSLEVGMSQGYYLVPSV